MAAQKKRVRTKQEGFIAANLIKRGDRTLYNRFIQEVENEPELDQSKLVRLALKEYFERKDEQAVQVVPPVIKSGKFK